MSYEIESLVGVGSIKFGMSRDEIQQVVGIVPKQVKLSPTDKTESDVFSSTGIIVEYDDTGCMSVQFSGPVMPTFEGKDLLSMTIEEACDWLESLDEETEIEDKAGCTSEALGISFYGPVDKVTSVLAFKEGYYD